MSRERRYALTAIEGPTNDPGLTQDAVTGISYQVDSSGTRTPLGGGGGSLPSWWTVDSTPGSENVTFNGVLIGKDPNNDYYLYRGYDPDGTTLRFEVGSDGTFITYGGTITIDDLSGNGIFHAGADGSLNLSDPVTFDQRLEINAAGEIGFFNATPVAQPTGVAATGPGVHAALVTLGLIAA